MDPDYFVTLYGYNYWANARLLNAAAALTERQFTEVPAYNPASVCTTLVHVMGTEWMWYQRCHGVSPLSAPAAVDYPDAPTLRAAWQEEELRMRDFVAELEADDLTKVISYRTTRGQEFSQPLWHILAHVVNHGTQHRSEAALILTDFGQSPGDLDLILYLRERPGRKAAEEGRVRG